MGCASSKDETELAQQVLGAKKAADTKAVRRLSALGMTEGEVWVTRQTGDIRKVFKFGQQINKGQFGVIHVVTDAAGNKYACKQISKRKLTGPNSIRDIRREIEIMHHLRGHPSVITFHGVYEDISDVFLVMELCTGGDLFEKIEKMATVTERAAAAMFRELVECVAYCHTLGVMHRDLKPENFLVTDRTGDARIKLSDFGLSTFFREGQADFADVLGSAYYMAPEVLERSYGKSCDVWSLGVILHVLLSGAPPFAGATDAEIMKAVRSRELDLTAKPWPSISRHARHLVSRMLEKDPEERIRLDQVLTHPWLRLDGTAPVRAVPTGVRDRIHHFRTLNLLKREARRVLATSLPPEEVAGLKLMFEALDTDADGLVSLEDLVAGLARKGEVLGGEEAAALLRSMDINGDGFIDYREFVAATYTLSKLQQSDVLLRTFRHFDLDGDGYISKEELAAALAKLPAAASSAASARESVSGLLAEADLDKDGRLNYREFCTMLLAAPGLEAGTDADASAAEVEAALRLSGIDLDSAMLPGTVNGAAAALPASASAAAAAAAISRPGSHSPNDTAWDPSVGSGKRTSTGGGVRTSIGGGVRTSIGGGAQTSIGGGVRSSIGGRPQQPSPQRSGSLAAAPPYSAQRTSRSQQPSPMVGAQRLSPSHSQSQSQQLQQLRELQQQQSRKQQQQPAVWADDVSETGPLDSEDEEILAAARRPPQGQAPPSQSHRASLQGHAPPAASGSGLSEERSVRGGVPRGGFRAAGEQEAG
ncbi:hypothetical protein HXX76_001022 [Chlamydomonas incerta]|uniref:Uncharacterized protein n=1 Tax=Chlamydomonas incerta TaxID=51695 RepID=A0A835WBC0_CHLIN|nr:hypothetical protein HXX76_001022 [Chlamydomonas incerta]|eukprot:KAG2444265.1 hypothetical protein HXX76_001022 [Chlamydomonas incerta]